MARRVFYSFDYERDADRVQGTSEQATNSSAAECVMARQGDDAVRISLQAGR